MSQQEAINIYQKQQSEQSQRQGLSHAAKTIVCQMYYDRMNVTDLVSVTLPTGKIIYAVAGEAISCL